MANKVRRKLLSARSAFDLWRIKNGLTNQDCTELFACSTKTISILNGGVNPHSGEPMLPDLSQRRIMRLIDEGTVLPEPWPVTLPSGEFFVRRPHKLRGRLRPEKRKAAMIYQNSSDCEPFPNDK